jgi:hypothetical protein
VRHHPARRAFDAAFQREAAALAAEGKLWGEAHVPEGEEAQEVLEVVAPFEAEGEWAEEAAAGGEEAETAVDGGAPEAEAAAEPAPE